MGRICLFYRTFCVIFEVTTGGSVEDPSLFGKDQPAVRCGAGRQPRHRDQPLHPLVARHSRVVLALQHHLAAQHPPAGRAARDPLVARRGPAGPFHRPAYPRCRLQHRPRRLRPLPGPQPRALGSGPKLRICPAAGPGTTLGAGVHPRRRIRQIPLRRLPQPGERTEIRIGIRLLLGHHPCRDHPLLQMGPLPQNPKN